jgi:lipoate-protein ligase A
MTSLDGKDFAPIDWAVLRGFLHLRGAPATDYAYRVFEAEETLVVLGRSRKAEEDVDLERCARDGVPLLRRAGGGGTVVLSRGIVVVSVAGRTTFPFRLKEHMNAVNRLAVSALESMGVKNLSIKGVSDIACGDRKLAGSSLYRTRDIVLYQGSLLVRPDFGLFDRYLRHPSNEPDYRRGRAHRDFLTCLAAEGCPFSAETVASTLRAALAGGSPFRLAGQG